MYTPYASAQAYSVEDPKAIAVVIPKSQQAAMLGMSREQQARYINEARQDAGKQATLRKTGKVYYHGVLASPVDEWTPIEAIEDMWTASPLKVWRELRGMTRDQLSKISTVPLHEITAIEKREDPGSIETLRNLAGPLDVTLTNLTTRTK